jgi:hypothetical protein
MPASPLLFPEWLQPAVSEGSLTPHQAWRLYWEMEVLSDQPWTPGVREINLLLSLANWEPSELETRH